MVVMADDLASHLAEEAFDPLHRVLQAAGIIHGKAQPDRCEERNQEQHHENFHSEAVRNRGQRVLGMNADRLQQREHGGAEQAVEQRGEPELLHSLNPIKIFGQSAQYPRRKA